VARGVFLHRTDSIYDDRPRSISIPEAISEPRIPLRGEEPRHFPGIIVRSVALSACAMAEDRDPFEPAPPPRPSTLPEGLRARLRALGPELAGLAAALTRHVRQEQARFERRRQRRRDRSSREGRDSA
jgi:hypothetical protein